MTERTANHCPRCNYPQAAGRMQRGIYKPGEKCAWCGHMNVRKLTEDEYMMTQALLLNAARIIRLLPLRDFLMAIELAETTGPILDPTLWRAAAGTLEEIKNMAHGALSFQNSLPRVCPQCQEKPLAYPGAKYCGATCSEKAEAGEPPAGANLAELV